MPLFIILDAALQLLWFFPLRQVQQSQHFLKTSDLLVFNPLFRFLKDNLSNWQETACDEEVTKIFGKEEKDKYIQLFIKILGEKPFF
mgnify:CR=1 FL=1